ncbi:BON domain-containing protein [Methylobacter sp. YRD-M1]|uniref:BON domain-containing protein n=1 Tax=Methylobacter sp. YRD-M1 TaxID=2911520 RepID=UPI00227CCDFA|nr:BON domain-containing protein [Methylobacter sp. YRD-M1]WAK03585.1 BON domain-containing protein [Methylobacter sp. YRD-M1]
MKIKNDQPVIFSNNLFVTLLLAAVVGLTGCKQEGPAEEAGKKVDEATERTQERLEEGTEQRQESMEKRDEAMGQKSGSVEEYLDDSAITAKIKAEMVADPLLSATKIDVVTDKGVVKLSGVLNSQQSADRALEIARGIKGVKSVESNLVVSPVAK